MIKKLKIELVLILSLICLACTVFTTAFIRPVKADEVIALTETKLTIDGSDYSTELTVDGTTHSLRYGQRGGASLRILEPTGIRFESFISEADYLSLVDTYGAQNVILGALIIKSSVANDYMPTFDNLEGLYYKDSVAEKIAQYKVADEGKDNGIYRFNTVIADIPATDYDTVVTARSYVKVIKGETEYIAYTNYSVNDNSRSARQVATIAAGKANLDITNAEWSVIESIANVVDKTSVATLEIEAQSSSDLKTQIANVAKENGLFTVNSYNINKILDEANLNPEDKVREDVKDSVGTADGYLFNVDAGTEENRTRILRVYTDNAIYRVKVLVVSKVITTADELLNLKAYSKVSDIGTSALSGASGIEYYAYDAYFVLGGNIDLTGRTISTQFGYEYSVWAPNATTDYNTKQIKRGFTGTFDGRGYTLNGGNYNEGGLFGSVATSGVVKNFAVRNATIVRTTWIGEGHNMSSVLGGIFAGTLDNVLVDVGYSGSGNGNALAGMIAGATVKNTVIYSDLQIANNIYGGYSGRPGAKAENVIYISSSATITAAWQQSTAFAIGAGVTKYATGTDCSKIDFSGLESVASYWNFTGNKATFKTYTVLAGQEYEIYTGLDANNVRIANTNNFAIDLTGYSIPNDVVVKVNGNDVTSKAVITDNAITLPASSLTAGEGSVTVSSSKLSLEVPVKIYTAILTTANDILYLQNYADKVNETVSTLAPVGMPIYEYGGYFVLGGNISLSGDIKTDFGYEANLSAPHDSADYVNKVIKRGFTGTFDGRGYTLNGGTYAEGGLFGSVATSGVVKNLSIRAAMIKRTAWVDGGAFSISAIMGGMFAGTMDNVIMEVTWDYNGTGNQGALIAGKIAAATIKNTIIYADRTLNLAANIYKAGSNGLVAAKAENVIVVTDTGTIADAWLQSPQFAIGAGVTKYAKGTACSAIDFSGFASLSSYWNFTGAKAVMIPN